LLGGAACIITLSEQVVEGLHAIAQRNDRVGDAITLESAQRKLDIVGVVFDQ
jgi:hypothetical protein